MKGLGAVIFLLFAILLSGCSNTIHGTEQLIEKAREVIPISDADTIQIEYAGACVDTDTAILWFISGNPYQKHYYLPMECELVGDDKYKFIRTYKPVESGPDLVALHWKDTYCFLIHNPNCRFLQITEKNGNQEKIEVTEYPFTYFYQDTPAEYTFLDKNGGDLS